MALVAPSVAIADAVLSFLYSNEPGGKNGTVNVAGRAAVLQPQSSDLGS